jgi:3-deoxy-D-manno-octulosonic-acid transferase
VWERANGALKSPEAVAKLDEVLGWIQAKASDAVESDAGSMLIDENARKEARKLLVVGSAWPEDLELILKGASLIPKFWSSSNLLVVPHDIRKASVDKMAELLANYGMKARVYLKTDENSNLSAETITPDPRPTALILNSMGFLAECYKLADGVWVGGAVAGKIHNVLEPAVFMKNIAHGQNFQSQVEATLLVEKGLSTVVKTPEEFRDWWQSLDADLGPSHSPSSVQAKLRDFMFKNLGASKRIVEDVLQLVESK